jgi:hypothetical protein
MSWRMILAGHVACTGEKRNRVLLGKPDQNKLLGRPRRMSEGNIKIDLREIGWSGIHWIRLFQDRSLWWDLVNMVMNELYILGYKTCSSLKVNRSFRGTCSKQILLATYFTLVSCLAYSSPLKMEAICSSKTLVIFQQTKRCYILEDKTLHNHSLKNTNRTW